MFKIRIRLFGTEIYISFLFAALIALMIAIDRTGYIIPMALFIILHEIGHLFAMWILECNPKSINLVPQSIEIVREFPKKPYGETVIAVMGPAVNILMFAVLMLNYLYFRNETLLEFSLLNLIIGVFNLLPVIGLDGGTIVFDIASRRLGFTAAQTILKTSTLICGLFLLFAGVIINIKAGFNPSILIIAIYLIISALVKCS